MNINDIKQGMELGENIVNFEGTILLKAGARITEKHLEALQMWGITEANIIGVEKDRLAEPSMPAVNPEVIARIDKELADHFQKTDLNNPIISEIYKLVKKMRLRRLTHE